MQKYILTAISTALLGIIIFLGGLYGQVNNVVKNMGSGSGPYYLQYIRSANSTTTVSYLSTTAASTTVVYDIHNITDIDMNLAFTASTTGTSKLVYSFAFSNNYVPSTGNGDFYGEDGVTNNSNISSTHGAQTVIHDWTPTGSSPAKKNISIPDVRAKYMRVSFGVQGANGSLYYETALQEPQSR